MMIFDGEEYVSTKEASKMLDDLFSLQTVRTIAESHKWKIKRIGRFYYFRKSDVTHPNWKMAKWQLALLQYFHAVARGNQDTEMVKDVETIIDGDSYCAAAIFIREVGFQQLTSGSLLVALGDECPTYVVGTVQHREDLLLVLSDNVTVRSAWISINDVLSRGQAVNVNQLTVTRLAYQLWGNQPAPLRTAESVEEQGA